MAAEDAGQGPDDRAANCRNDLDMVADTMAPMMPGHTVLVIDVSSRYAGHGGVVVACSGDRVVVRVDAEVHPAPLAFRRSGLALDRVRTVDLREGNRGG